MTDTLETARAFVAAQRGRAYTSDWVEITQAMIQAFADVSRDHQFIHVDPERAALTPLGGTIAHGFMILSLLPHLHEQAAIPGAPGVTMGMNYGLDQVRFVSPIRSGSRVRAVFTIGETVEKRDGEFQQSLDIVIEGEAGGRPAIVARWIVYFRIG